VAQVDIAQEEVEIELQVPSTGAGAEVGGRPTTAASVGADADCGEAGRWGRDGTPSGTLGEHYRTELP
jgi:hypothetical protein